MSTTEVRLISKPEVLDRVGFSYPTIWKWMIAGTFPRSREVGGKSMWIETEIEMWITSRPRAVLKGEKGSGLPPHVYTAPNPRRFGKKDKPTKNKRRATRGEARVEV